MTVDRTRRNNLIIGIQEFLSGRITAGNLIDHYSLEAEKSNDMGLNTLAREIRFVFGESDDYVVPPKVAENDKDAEHVLRFLRSDELVWRGK